MTAWFRYGAGAGILVLLGAAFGWQLIARQAEQSDFAGGAALQKNQGPKQVLLVRHAEKPIDEADVHLTSRGAARAAALPSLFFIPPTFPTNPATFTAPDFLFAAKASKHSNRSIETLTPLAKALDKPFDHKHPDRDFAVMVEHIFDDAKYVDKTVLIGWHHGNMPEIAAAIVAKAKNANAIKGQVPDRWRAPIYDRLWIITFDDRRNATFANLPQKLLFGDSKN